ncbi:uncharacterized protein LOC107265558 [Cephus cinctus]|uniref:Uncharacterized protein LOC107265558 n=1 Tax=Cephus cinctus TaxID=211228 RepID=A0AAJ7BNV4_CEPCN|nr:uncharacterized protein LOC107265558 [Cephus cinctus]
MDVRNGWNNLFPQDISAMNIDYDLQSDAFCEMIRQLPGQEELTVEDMNKWLNQDDNELGWKILSDEEIVSGVELDNHQQFEDDELSAKENDDGADIAQSPRAALGCVDGLIA